MTTTKPACPEPAKPSPFPVPEKEIELAKNVLIIGAGGVAQVVAHKVAQNASEFGTLHIASRTVSKA